ncbi:MAG: hypothetical protein AB1698_03320 [Pseudomonadota bacterium]
MTVGALVLPPPGANETERVAQLIWEASRRLLTATRWGRRDIAAEISRALANTREHPSCTPPMARVINSALGIALRQFGGATPDLSPLQPDDGEAA